MAINDPVSALQRALNAYVVSQETISQAAQDLAAEHDERQRTEAERKATGGDHGVPTQG